jgi:hypothetical protein
MKAGVQVRRRRRWKEETRKGAPFLVLEGRGAEMKWIFFWKEKQGLEEGDQAKPPFAPSLFFSFLFSHNILPPYYAVPEVIIATWL